MHRSNHPTSVIFLLILMVSSGPAFGGIQFEQNHFYGSADYYNNFPRTLYEYDPAGHFIGSLTLPFANELHGVAFGPDGLLYAASEDPSPDFGYSVYALDSNGTVHTEYRSTDNILGGFAGSGKIAFDSDGHFYVAGRNGLDQFSIGNANSAILIYHDTTIVGSTDVKALPNGDLLLANNSNLFEITSTGAVVRSYFPGGSNHFYQLRGVEYDPNSNQIFTCQLGAGIGDQEHTLAKLDGNTGALISYTTFAYAQDLILATDGQLVSSSWIQTPGFFSQQPAQTGSFSSPSYPWFITQYVPEPVLAPVLGILLLAIRTRRPLARGPRLFDPK